MTIFLLLFCVTATATNLPPMLDLPLTGLNPDQIDFSELPVLTGQHALVTLGASPWLFRLHGYVTYFEGKYWCLWSHGPVIEDRPTQHIRYATSLDGLNWSAENEVTGPSPLENFRYIARGFWVRDGKLLAIASHDEAGGYFGQSLQLLAFEWNGVNQTWGPASLVFDDAINNFPPRLLPNGQWAMICRDHNRNISLLRGGVTASSDWTAIPLVGYQGDEGFRPEEPDWWTLPDNRLLAVYRDNGGSRRLFRALSDDNGNSWTEPEPSNFPDAVSKFFGLRTSRGYYVLISNANPAKRNPLCLSTSEDGITFTRMARLPIPVTPQGGAVDTNHTSGTYQYPHAIEQDGNLLISFSRNKTSIEVVRISLDEVDRLRNGELYSGCVQIVPENLRVVAGQANKGITVSIPIFANSSNDFHVTLTSLQPDIAIPVDAENGSLNLTFPAGNSVSRTVGIEALSAGAATFVLANTNGVCVGEPAIIVVDCPVNTETKTENFSVEDNGWVELGSRSNGQNFGYSDGTHAGGAAGQAGGIFKRDDFRAAYVNRFNGKLTLNDAFGAKGKIIVPGPFGANLGPVIGHADSRLAGQPTQANQIGFLIGGSGKDFVVHLSLADAQRRESVRFLVGLSTNTVYDWEYEYDPGAGSSGNGALTVRVSDHASTNIGVYELTAEDRAIGAEFDCFGMTSRALSSSDAFGTVFMDDVTFTIPMSLTIAQMTLNGSNINLRFTTPRTCREHLIEVTTDLTSPNWATVSNVPFSVVSEREIEAQIPMPSGPAHFFRVSLP